jgi:hypothetical protein
MPDPAAIQKTVSTSQSNVAASLAHLEQLQNEISASYQLIARSQAVAAEALKLLAAADKIDRPGTFKL